MNGCSPETNGCHHSSWPSYLGATYTRPHVGYDLRAHAASSSTHSESCLPAAGVSSASWGHPGPAPAATTSLRIVPRAPVTFMFVALVRSARSVRDVAPPAAVISACPKLRIEGVQHFDVEGASWTDPISGLMCVSYLDL